MFVEELKLACFEQLLSFSDFHLFLWLNSQMRVECLCDLPFLVRRGDTGRCTASCPLISTGMSFFPQGKAWVWSTPDLSSCSSGPRSLPDELAPHWPLLDLQVPQGLEARAWSPKLEICWVAPSCRFISPHGRLLMPTQLSLRCPGVHRSFWPLSFLEVPGQSLSLSRTPRRISAWVPRSRIFLMNPVVGPPNSHFPSPWMYDWIDLFSILQNSISGPHPVA